MAGMLAASLQPGGTIGVFAPSSRVERDDIERAARFVEGLGFRVFIHPQTYAAHHQAAGSAEEKARAFNDLAADPAIDAIFAARGGNRAIGMLAGIDYDLIRRHPKIVVGYSDATCLLNAICQETGLVTFHGPIFRELPTRDLREVRDMLDLLAGGAPVAAAQGCRALCEGEARGRLIGGSLSVFQALAGTRWQPDTDGAILFFEDAGDHISRYDRMFAHLRLAGLFDRAAGIVCGSFTNMQDGAERPFGFTLDEVVREHCRTAAGDDIPIIMDAPFGHNGPLCTLPVGGIARIAAQGGRVSIVPEGPFVRT